MDFHKKSSELLTFRISTFCECFLGFQVHLCFLFQLGSFKLYVLRERLLILVQLPTSCNTHEYFVLKNVRWHKSSVFGTQMAGKVVTLLRTTIVNYHISHFDNIVSGIDTKFSPLQLSNLACISN